MTETLNVDVKRTGFPVIIGGISLWFDTSDERLANFFDFEAESQKRLTEFEKEIIQLENEESSEKETVLGAIELEKKLLEIQYDLLFGEGTFAKLYAEFPDHQALNNTLEHVAILVDKKLNDLKIERDKINQERIERYTKKGSKAKQKK